ncbi:glycosyltransferase [Cyanobacteria bacterium FACHB-63]|nr:glycosyltransferase [Cyanobacteria bacterium FACHB-63]
MKKQVVGMVSSYVGLKPSPIDWLWQQSPYPFGHWGNIQLEASAANPDFLLLYQFDFPRPKPPKTITSKVRAKLRPTPLPDVAPQFRGAPRERMIYLLREPPLDEILHITKANYEKAQQHCAYVSGPDDYAPVPDYMPAIWYLGNSFRELNEMPPPEKVRKCSWITSGISRSENHLKRLAFLKLLQQNGLEFDLYGRDLPDWAITTGRISGKWYGMAPYYYNLAIENYAENDWYVTEKLWDALLAWCLPIYYGGSAADKLLPPGSFLRLPSMDEKGWKYIEEVIATPDAWYEAKDAIAEARQVILHKLNLMNWLSEYVERVS